MKLRIAAISLLLAALFTVTVGAQSVKFSDDGFSVTVPDEYTVLTTSNLSKNKDFLTALGHTVESFKRSMTDADMVMYAATDDNQRQLQVKVWESDFSSVTGDLSTLDDDASAKAISTIGEGISSGNHLLGSSEITKDGMRFYRFVVRVEGNRPFCYVQYLTVQNGKFYALVYYNSDAEITADQQTEAQTAFNSFTVKKQKTGGLFESNTVLQIIGVGLIIIAAAALVIYLIVSFYKDIKSGENSQEVIPDRIKMKRK